MNDCNFNMREAGMRNQLVFLHLVFSSSGAQQTRCDSLPFEWSRASAASAVKQSNYLYRGIQFPSLRGRYNPQYYPPLLSHFPFPFLPSFFNGVRGIAPKKILKLQMPYWACQPEIWAPHIHSRSHLHIVADMKNETYENIVICLQLITRTVTGKTHCLRSTELTTTASVHANLPDQPMNFCRHISLPTAAPFSVTD